MKEEMKIGEIVESLIWLRDSYDLRGVLDEAVCAACNILSKLPNMMEEDEAKEIIARLAKDGIPSD